MNNIGMSILYFFASIYYLVTLPFVIAPLFFGVIYQHYIQPFLLKPIDSSENYYKNIIGDIYYNYASCGLSDVCMDKTEFNKIKNVDKKSFEVLKIQSPYESSPEIIDSGYAKDMHHVYFNDQVLIGADPKSFHAVSDHMGKDKYTCQVPRFSRTLSMNCSLN